VHGAAPVQFHRGSRSKAAQDHFQIEGAPGSIPSPLLLSQMVITSEPAMLPPCHRGCLCTVRDAVGSVTYKHAGPEIMGHRWDTAGAILVLCVPRDCMQPCGRQSGAVGDRGDLLMVRSEDRGWLTSVGGEERPRYSSAGGTGQEQPIYDLAHPSGCRTISAFVACALADLGPLFGMPHLMPH
jgi:hypothetical protein